MNILQVTNGFPPVDRGGVETYTLALSRSLRSAGHDVVVFCREPGDGRPIYSVRDEIVEDIPVRFVANRFDGATPLASRYFDRRIEALFVRWVEEQRPDVIHFQHTHGLSASLLARAAEMGVPFVMTLHDYWYMCPQVNLLRPDNALCAGIHHGVNCYECIYGRSYPPLGPGRPDFDAPLSLPPVEPAKRHPLGLNDETYYPLQKILPWPVRRLLLGLYDVARLRVLPPARSLWAAVRPVDMEPLRVRARYMRDVLTRCEYIVVPSAVVKTQYVDFGVPAERLYVIPHGMDTSLWEGFRPAQRPRGPGLRFGYIGSLLRNKGVDFIVQAFRRLDAPGTELWLHGFELPGAPFAKWLHELANGDSRIHFAGPYTPPELPAILNRMDVLLIPSRWHETFSIVTREALLAGLPVIASRMGGIPDAIEDGVNGVLLPPDDMEAWLAAMRRAVEERDWVAALHRAQLTHQVKSMDAHAAELAQLYTQVRDGL